MSENKNRTTVPATDVECTAGNESLEKEKGKGLDTRVDITITSHRKRKHDPDGISAKAVLDGLVHRKILLDDSWEEIRKVTFESKKCEKGEDERTIIEIEDT